MFVLDFLLVSYCTCPKFGCQHAIFRKLAVDSAFLGAYNGCIRKHFMNILFKQLQKVHVVHV